jgi:Predicted membrane GTPase involved in stress response
VKVVVIKISLLLLLKGKNLTNTRASGKDHAAAIKTPKAMSLEQSIEFLNEDELCEVTPKSVRLRKKILNTNERKKFDKTKKMSK